MSRYRVCAIIPTYDNPATLERVVERVRRCIPDVLVIDDGSAAAGRAAAERLAAAGAALVQHRDRNGGKGAAVKDGFTLATARGFTHALQIDADGQHDTDDIPRFLATSRQHPGALVLGAPQFDATVPKSRLRGRQITLFWTHLEAGRGVIRDPMCGFRVYPLAAALAAAARGNRMDFDIEIAVRMAWRAVPVINLPTRVRYLPAAQGGVSHFRMVRDNVRISLAHTRLFLTAVCRWLSTAARKPFARRASRGLPENAVTDQANAPPLRRNWTDVAEVGSAFGIRCLVVVLAVLGRPVARALLWPITCYHALASPRVRQASRTYLGRMDLPCHGWAVFKHLLRFAQCTLDRLLFVSGKTEALEITRSGDEHIEALLQSKRGAILLGAHLGSFEALRTRDTTIHVVGYFRNARMLNALLDRINPNLNTRLIEADPANIGFALRVAEIIDRGGLVGMLGDRVMPGVRTTEVNFLGQRAQLPAGPFHLAAALGCPIYLTFALHQPPNRYDLYCEPFAETVTLPRAQRAQAIQAYAQQYADRLAHYCRLAPENWFNFYDFWSVTDV